MKNGITEAKRYEESIYRKIEVARRLQAVPKYRLAKAMNVSDGRVTQIFNDHSMSVRQMCQMAEELGLEIILCAKQ